MCCTFLVQIVYGAVSFVAIAMTITAMVTPGWTTYSYEDSVEQISQGIFPWTCSLPGDTPSTNPFSWSSCADWYDNLPTSEKVVVACMCIALLLEAVCFVYNIFTICACCCKQYLIHPLSAFTIGAIIFLAVSIIIYAIDNKNYIELTNPDFLSSDSYSYSFWLTVGALILNVINTIVAGTAIFCAETCC